MDRREFIRKSALVGAGAAACAAGVLSWRSSDGPDAVVEEPAPLRWREEDRVVRPSDLVGNAPKVMNALWHDRPAVVFKLTDAALRAAAEARGYNTGQFALRHPDEPDHVLLAYDAICTHLGCTVGWNAELGGSIDVEDYDGDGEPEGRILCPCHQSQFDVYDLGLNVPGVPAQRPLDVIPLALGSDDGGHYLVGQRRLVQHKAREADEQGGGAAYDVPPSTLLPLFNRKAQPG